MRRAIELIGTNIVLELSKATSVVSLKPMIHFDQLPDGTWRLIYSKDLIPDFTLIDSFKVIRED